MPEIKHYTVKRKEWIILKSYRDGRIKYQCDYCKTVDYMNENHLVTCSGSCQTCHKILDNPLHKMFHHKGECYFGSNAGAEDEDDDEDDVEFELDDTLTLINAEEITIQFKKE